MPPADRRSAVSAVEAAVSRALAERGGEPGTLPGRVYVAFSGGMDSTVLLHAVVRRAVALDPRVGEVVALHVDHGLHADSGAWSRHCAGVARSLGVGFVAHRVNAAGSGGVEARAREARYQAFESCLTGPGDRLLLAHHRDDQVETGLLRLVQGRGLYGMPERRMLGAGWLVRPLLELSRDLLARYAREAGLEWLDDPSNAADEVDRNFLRHRVLPQLRRRWPDVGDAMLAAIARGREADRRRAGDLPGGGPLPLTALPGGDSAERVARLRVWLAGRGEPLPRREALAEFLRQLDRAGDDRQPSLRLDSGAFLRFHRDSVHLVAAPPPLEKAYDLALPGAIRLPHGDLTVVRDPAGSAAEGPLQVRFRRGGEQLRAGNHHVSVKSLLQRAGMPPWQRHSHPLVFDARGLLAVPGVAVRREPVETTGVGVRVRWLPHDDASGDFL
jgi:tRNA(Ile)-lysidine synthase